jgi:hypothetical protein
MRENLTSALADDRNEAEERRPAVPRICSRLRLESEASIGGPPEEWLMVNGRSAAIC